MSSVGPLLISVPNEVQTSSKDGYQGASSKVEAFPYFSEHADCTEANTFASDRVGGPRALASDAEP